MLRNLVPSLLCLMIVLPGVSSADATKDALAGIPGDAIAFVCIPSVKQLDDDYQQAVNNLGLQQMIPPQMQSLTGFIRQSLPMFQGFDEAGTLALVLMPVQNFSELAMKMALLVPAKEPKAMLQALGGQPGEGGVWTVSLFGHPTYAAAGEKRVVFAQMPDVAKAIVSSKATMAEKLKESDAKALSGLGLALWIDAGKILKIVKPQIDALASVMAMAQGLSGPVGIKQAELTKQQIDTFVEGASSLAVGLSIKQPGLTLRFALSINPGTELAKQSRMKSTTESLLRGLPGENFLAAFGQTVDPAQTTASLKALDPYVEMAKEVEGIDIEKVKQLKGLLDEWVPTMTGLQASIQLLSPGPQGLFGFSAIVKTSDSGKWLGILRKEVNLVKTLLSEMDPAAVDQEVLELGGAITYVEGAEEIGGSKVDHFKLDLSIIDDIDEEDLEEVYTVIGKDGPLFRIAPVDSTTVAIGFGGGTKHMGGLIERIKKQESPLDDDAGIKKVSSHVPEKRASVTYVAVDRIMEAVGAVTKALEEELFPVQMPIINAPLAIIGSGGEDRIQVDVFFPTELLAASKNAAMMLMGSSGQPAGPSSQPPPAPPQTPAPVPTPSGE